MVAWSHELAPGAVRDEQPIWENTAHLTRPALADTAPPCTRSRRWYGQVYADARAHGGA